MLAAIFDMMSPPSVRHLPLRLPRCYAPPLLLRRHITLMPPLRFIFAAFSYFRRLRFATARHRFVIATGFTHTYRRRAFIILPLRHAII